MFLKRLEIATGDGEVIREIPFKQGVNLIVDESPEAQESGNNVGKTTVLRLVDFCLGAKDGKKIYTDPEFGTESEVKSFLEENAVLVTLELARDFSQGGQPSIVVERNFLKGKSKIIRINGEDVPGSRLQGVLSNLLFFHDDKRPTFRQIISKNIRDDHERMSHIVRVLHATTTKVEYQTVYQFWFGLDSSGGEQLEKEKRALKSQKEYKKELARQFNVNELNVIPDLEAEIARLKTRRSSYDLSEDYSAALAELDALKVEVATVASGLSAVRLQVELIDRSRASLEEEFSAVDVDHIERLYREANVFFPKLHRSFDESVTFYNELMQRKIEFITLERPGLIERESELAKRLAELEVSMDSISNQFQHNATLEEVSKLSVQIDHAVTRHSTLVEQRRLWMQCTNELSRLEKRYDLLSKEAKDINDQADDRLTTFNTRFKKFSKRLYGEQFLLFRKKVNKDGTPASHLQFEVIGVTANPGTGAKKGQITAFDLAYIEFAREIGVPYLNFLLYDQIETVDGGDISTILERLVPEVGCQYVASILRDKAPEGFDLNAHTILTLSQDDKLFRF